MTVKESLHNALKYAQATKVEVAIAVNENELQITIRDDGIGFDTTDESRYGNGLRNMRRRISEVGGDFLIKSGTDGTTITLRCPIPPTTKV